MPKVTVAVDAKSLEKKAVRAMRLVRRMRTDDVTFDRRLERLMALNINFRTVEG